MRGGINVDFFDDFNPELGMSATATTTVNRVPFDQNDKKYKCLCGVLHIKKGARLVAVLVNIITAINIIFSFTRSSTVIVYTMMSTAFSIVVFGSLLYGVWKEKRLYLYPYLLFQVLSIIINLIILLAFLISIAVGSKMILDLANNIGNIDLTTTQAELDAELAVFTVVFVLFLCIGGLIQAYFVEVIYCFHNFLKDRENSFSFNFESYANGSYAPEIQVPPMYPRTEEIVS